MERFLAKCIKDTTIDNIEVDKIYKIEYTTVFKIIYNETKKTYEFAIGNKDWFYEHFKPLKCNLCIDIRICDSYNSGREYACFGYQRDVNQI